MVVITGATGLLGKHITDRFVSGSSPVRCVVRSSASAKVLKGVDIVEGDILDPESLEQSFQGADTVIHAAAKVRFRKKERSQVMDVNVEGTTNVVNACLRTGVKRLVHISSIAALGKSDQPLVDESGKWAKSKVRSAYAESKYAAEQEVFRGQEEGLSTVILNPSVILGTSHPSRSSSRIFHYVWNNSRFYADGLLNYVDARDVADIAFRMQALPEEGQRYIVSAGAVSIKDILGGIARRLNRRAPTIRLSYGLVNVLARAEQARSFLTGSDPLVTTETARLSKLAREYDNRKLANLLGFRYRPLDETLDWCCAWYKEKMTTKDWS